jgi:hypothetical protein
MLWLVLRGNADFGRVAVSRGAFGQVCLVSAGVVGGVLLTGCGLLFID